MFDLTGDLNPYLAPNERVVWQGQGKRRIASAAWGGYFFMAMFVMFALIFGVMFVAFTSTSRGVRSSGDSIAFIVLPIVFLAVGMGVGIPWVMMGNRAGKARYFVTNLSAIVIYAPIANMGRRISVVALKNLQQITLNENRDGTGTLTFGSNPYAAYGRYASSWAVDSVPAFANIEKPSEVYQLIRKQMDELNNR